MTNETITYKSLNDFDHKPWKNTQTEFLVNKKKNFEGLYRDLTVIPNQDVHDLIDYLTSRKIPMGYITRGTRDRQEWKLDQIEILSAFNGPTIVTGDYSKIEEKNKKAYFNYTSKKDLFRCAVMKAEDHIYHENTPFNPSQILYVDDRLKYTLSAAKEGMTSVWFDAKGIGILEAINEIVEEDIKGIVDEKQKESARYHLTQKYTPLLASVHMINNINQLNPLKN